MMCSLKMLTSETMVRLYMMDGLSLLPVAAVMVLTFVVISTLVALIRMFNANATIVVIVCTSDSCAQQSNAIFLHFRCIFQ